MTLSKTQIKALKKAMRKRQLMIDAASAIRYKVIEDFGDSFYQMAEGFRLSSESHKLYQEANILWSKAVIKWIGKDTIMEWNKWFSRCKIDDIWFG